MNEDLIQLLRGAPADIAFSDDMTLELARQKAKRIYEETKTHAITRAVQRELEYWLANLPYYGQYDNAEASSIDYLDGYNSAMTKVKLAMKARIESLKAKADEVEEDL